MPSPARGTRAVLTAAGTAACIACAAAAASASSAPSSRLVHRCVAAIIGSTRPPAHALPGSASPQIAAELSIFAAPRTGDDALPAAADLDRSLAAADATVYDPSMSVRLNVSTGTSGHVWAVPATLTTPTLPAACTTLRQVAGLRAWFTLRTAETGSGPGVCVITSGAVSVQPAPAPVLPGQRRPVHHRPSVSVNVSCESLSAMASYTGVTGALSSAGAHVALIPNSVSSLTYALPDGQQLTAPVTDNLLQLPVLPNLSFSGHLSPAKLREKIAAALPTSATENGPSGAPVASFTRPTWVVDGYAALLDTTAHISVVSNSSSQGTYVSCSARTHRCVAAIVTATCASAKHSCHLSREVVRYRYVTARPPSGTTGNNVVPAAPIRARVDRYLLHPRKLSLSLSGAHHSADLVVSVTCFSRHGSISGSDSSTSGPVQRVAVPSQTPIAVPGHVRACDVDLLVTSDRPGRIRARLVRG